VSIDIGTGSGQAVLRRARQNPDELAIGLDTDALAMADASRRAAAGPRRGGLANALFLAASAEELPGPLAGRAGLVTVVLPWRALLGAFLAPDVAVVRGIADVLHPGGELVLLISATDRDAAVAGLTLRDASDAGGLGAVLESAGLDVVDCRLADRSDVENLSSAWGKRLGIPARRAAWLLRARRRHQVSGSGTSALSTESARS
jgi:SAM-dependent methyltransferase